MLFGRLLDPWNVDGVLWAWMGYAGECRFLFLCWNGVICASVRCGSVVAFSSSFDFVFELF